MVSIIDYGVGNLFSLRSSFAAIGVEAEVTSDPETIRRADRVILPGVGAFGDAAIREARKFIGIEIDPTHFAIAEKRIKEAQMQPPLEGLR